MLDSMHFYPELFFAIFSGAILFVAGLSLQRQHPDDIPMYLPRLGYLGSAIIWCSTYAATASIIVAVIWGLLNTSIVDTVIHFLLGQSAFGLIHGLLRRFSYDFYDVYFMGVGAPLGYVLVIVGQALLWL